ncbi:T9SS type A sorting domain-containing protein [Neolewinella antarctica]|uniref:Secretion system C-terminal sorting domain-containing protein n=1 Tax=Neolewinella antarctica TaxID=442734 RepID=A0ABX0X722_9BACT|nr:T9SS type A sorting domain-containing protein [Neolewinella antarctica]NJC24937.1 hypothetical protein [Neolewinella antarctica]
MKFNFTLLFTLLVGLSATALTAQEEMMIEPGTGFLNQIILADTTATGERNDENRIYVLRRDAEYFVQGPFRTQTFMLHLKAEEGTGELPHVKPFADQDGAINGNLIRTYADAIFENIYLDGQANEEGQPYPARILRMEGEGANLTVRGCILNNGAQSALRVNSAAGTILFENTVVANMGAIAQDNMGNGRVIDCRGSAVQMLKLEDCTFVNTMDRIIRHRGGSGVLDSFEMNHSTAVNHMGYHGVIELGNVGDYVKITDNLFYDVFSMGVDSTDAERLTEFDATTEVDAAGNPIMVWVGSIPNDSTEFIIDQNIYGISPELQAWYDEYDLDEGPNQILTNHIADKVAQTTVMDSVSTPFAKADVTLTEVPMFAKELQDWYWRPTADGGAGKSKVTTTEFTMNREMSDYFGYEATLDASYNTSDSLLTGTGGAPVGDRTWMSTITNTNDPQRSEVAMRSFPNPISSNATLEYTLEQAATVRMELFDLNGRQLRQANLGQQSAGVHSTTLERGNLAPGLYLIRISGNGRSGMLRVTVQ